MVMVDESVLGLSPIATTILEAVPEGSDVNLQAVTAHVVAAYGPPDGSISAGDITRQQVWDLVAHKVLVIVEDEGSRDGASSLLDPRVEDLSGGQRAAAVTAVRDALRHLRSDNEGRWAAPDSLSPHSLVEAARQHHLVPFLAANLDRLDIPGQARSELEAISGRQHAGALVLATDLSAALETLRGADIRALAFKGVALAVQAYGDFRARGAGDLDLLVAPGDLARAHKTLTAAGWKPVAGYPIPDGSWGWRHFARTGNELTLSGAGSDIDLHWHLAPTRGTFPNFETLWRRHAVVSVAGHAIATLSAYDALAHSAGHAAKDEWRWLRSLLDVHVLMADGRTWSGADRPLRSDQLLSVGLAAREFGMPAGAPPVTDLAARLVSNSTLERVRNQQDETAPVHRSAAGPGIEFLHRLRTVRLTRGSATEAARLLSRSALPPWLTAQEPSPFAWQAAPRVLRRRVQEVLRKGTARLRAARP